MIKRLIGALLLMCLFTLPVLAATSSGCPSSGLTAFKVASNVSAYFTTSGLTDTYFFSSLTNENPVNGVPGLVKYCVYPSAQPKSIAAEYPNWISKKDPHDFAFVRPGGNKTNIPLDGTKNIEVGTATWATDLPTSQTILLHIADPKVCAGLYGGTPPTCFVKPTQACVAGDSNAAYNAIPTGAENCIPPSFGVEAYGFNELGDQVTLAGTARQLVSLNVLFTSYGCSVSGHWYSGDCLTNPGDTFNIPITANIYDSTTCSGTPVVCSAGPLASVTTIQTIPYRPSAAETTGPCSGTDPNGYAAGSRWFNPAGNGGAGACQYSIGKLLTFTFPAGIPLPNDVIWTVAYNTSHSGYAPIASPLGSGDACETSAGGCGYDSLNVGTKSYTGAPYAGTDDSEGVVFLSWWAGNGQIPGTTTTYPPPFSSGVLTPVLGIESTTDTLMTTSPFWIGLRPLGEIITTQ